MPRRPIDFLPACARIAAHQYGVISQPQARAAGLSKHAVSRLVVAGSWIKVRPAVYALWTPSTEADLWRHRLMAAALWLGEGSAVSHRASAVLCRLDGIASAPLELSTTRACRPSGPGLIVHRVQSLAASEVEWREGFPITRVPRTIIDLASVVDSIAVELALECALRAGLLTIEQLQLAFDGTAQNHRGRRTIGHLLDKHPGRPTESALETMVWQLIAGSDLSMPIRQHEVRDTNGRLIGRVDLAYVEARLAIEVDGYAYHSSSRDFRHDRARQNQLAGLGWTLYRVTWQDVRRRGPQVLKEIGDLLEHCLARRLPGQSA
jgi:very-short-patch-repair endonuclease